MNTIFRPPQRRGQLNLMEHLSFEQLEGYSGNKTAPEDLASIEEHLLVCEQCRRALDRLEEEARIMREALKNFKKPDGN